MRPDYKPVKELQPHCPECKERLDGNNSIMFPYRCSCGVWRQEWGSWDFTVEVEDESIQASQDI